MAVRTTRVGDDRAGGNSVGIDHDDEARVWLLRTPGTAYAVACPPEVTVHRQQLPDVLLHVYWGAPVTLADAVQIAAVQRSRWSRRGFESPLDGAEEYPVAGGLRFARPALAARFAGDVRSVEWRLTGSSATHDAGVHELTLEFTDAYFPLTVAVHYRIQAGTDVIERWVTATNTGSAVIELDRIDSAAWTLPEWDSYRLSHLIGRWSAETQLRRQELTEGTFTIGSRRGITSHHANPWFALDDGTATEQTGSVYSGALAWSGSWEFAAQRLGQGGMQVLGGLGHTDFGPYRLAAGESLDTPTFAGLYTSDGFGAASRGWHDYTMRHVLANADANRPVLYNSWEATGFDVNEQNQLALAAKAARIGCELFVMDDGWFGARTSAEAGLGDWRVNPDRFPNGLTPLIDEVRRLGMDFGIWVEPEMVNPDSDLYREHPDWVYHFPERTRHQMRNQLVLNLARPDVAEWMFTQLDTLLSDNDIRFVKWDMNRVFTEPGWPSNADNPARLWTDHVHNLYRVFDRLRAAHPDVAFESCSGGGGRIDLGILARTDQVWTSDNTDGPDRLIIQHGYSQLYPARAMSCWVTDVPNFLDPRTVPLRYRFHVAMAGVLGVGGDLSEWSDAELDEAAELITQYKKVRSIVQHGRLYRLRPPSDGLSAVQYVTADRAQAVVLAFLGAQRFGQRPPVLRLAGLDPAARYRANGFDVEFTGAALHTYGLPVRLQGDYDSVLVHLTRIDD
ncbi:alpha-galactosidase [Actinocatenispora comari]|uniref:Alpha-galactosidase n=1 Tax=Actinocatenispora comari TaxID=2807577 RepID=A0A8J4AI61_9ACTN|nr:alpha-galactosidase [Actinocatenispora comari]GIL31946.1 alpha-galactosidase [Actinocatenispora comari]